MFLRALPRGEHVAREQIMERYARSIVDGVWLSDIFSRAMGSYAYIARSAKLDDLLALAEYVQERAPA